MKKESIYNKQKNYSSLSHYTSDDLYVLANIVREFNIISDSLRDTRQNGPRFTLAINSYHILKTIEPTNDNIEDIQDMYIKLAEMHISRKCKQYAYIVPKL